MRRRLLYHKEVEHGPTLSMYEVKIDSFYYQIVGPEDTELSPIFEYHYYPKYTDGSVGDTVYINQLNQNEKSDEIGIRFTLDSSTEAEAKEAGTVLDENTGALTFNKWEEPAASETYRLLATVIMEVRYPNDFDRYPRSSDTRTAEAEQAALQIIWEDPIVNLSYDNAPAQPDEEGEVIQIKPNVTWTQQGSSGDPYTESNSPDAQYIYEKLEGDFEIDNNGVITVDPSTLTYSHSIGRVRVTVTHLNKEGSAECEVFQEAYTLIPEEATLGIDVLLFDEDTRDNIIVPKGDFDYSKYPKSQYTPIGLVVIPRDHGVYGDKNTIGVLSLMDADLSNPAEGGTHGNTIYGMINMQHEYSWVPYNVKDNEIYDEVIGSDDEWLGWITGSHDILFPSDMYSGLKNKLDEKTFYKDAYVERGFTSPYDNNGEFNKLYLADVNTEGEMLSVFQDFDGEQRSISLLHTYNHQATYDIYDDGYYSTYLFGTLKDDSVWRTSSKLSFVDTDDYNTSYPENYTVLPAMEACWRYSPENTHEGNWHLPSAGEWGYVMARAKAINNTLATLKSLYGINYSDIGDYGYITTTPEMSDAAYSMDEANAIISYFDGTVHYVSANKKCIARPMMRLKATTSSGSIGNTPLPTGYDSIDANNFLDDNRHKSRWCIYRNESACNNAYYPSYNASSSSNCKSGTVYGVLVKSDTDMTILKTDVELFSFDNLTCASGRLNRQFGYYNQDIEAGWYVIQKIVWDDGTTTSNIYSPSVVVGNTLQPTQVSSDGWLGTVSIIYDYKNESQLGYDSYTKGTYNPVLAAFRIGYWDKATAILLHSTTHGSTEKSVSPVYSGEYGNTAISYLELPKITVDMSDDSLQPTTNYEQTQYTVTIPAGNPFIVGSKDVLKVTFPYANYTGLGGAYEKFINNAYAATLCIHIMGNGDTFNDYGLVTIHSSGTNVNTNLSISAMSKAYGYEDSNHTYQVTSSPYYNSSTGYVEFDMSTIGSSAFKDKCRVRLFLKITVAGLDESFSIPEATQISV